MAGDSLEALLADEIEGGSPGELEGFRVAELIGELNRALNDTSFYAKSNISSRNLRGILKANSFQKYCEKMYGFRIQVLDKLITEKLENVLSVNGTGRREIIDIIGKGTMKIEAKSGLDIADRLFGGSPR